MNQDQLQQTIQGIIQNLSQQIPTYQWSTEDWSKHDGNVAVCIIDEEGNVYGRIWGNDKLKGRKTFDAAYRKAMQVWITGYATGDYEKKVFNGELNHRDYGIDLPELIGLARWPTNTIECRNLDLLWLQRFQRRHRFVDCEESC
jgi:glc operon protein GlcG